MAADWQQGRRPSVEDLLERYPGVASAPGGVLRLISEELCLRHEAGEEIDLQDFLARFPQRRTELELLLACDELFETQLPPDFPQAGDQCGEFLLVREIGRGSQGRVFLATQPALCDRPVIVKLTALNVAEHLSLARLQHTGIVPLYLAQDLVERRLRLLCMPFLGGASLATVSEAMKSVPVTQRTGKTMADALVRCHTETTRTTPLGGPALDFLSQATYVQAVCWIGACLAEGLHFAHQRGLVHFDVKPSNLLLAGDGQPMLLDFHLARGPIAARDALPDWVGGTKPYMPPEQSAALAAVRASRPVETAVDGRADIYALAVVLDELLGGEGPLARPLDGPYGLRCLNPHVSRSLADLLAKCLSPDPEARYADAQSLADDLRRHLADLPLRSVTNRSPFELWHKWRRRRPRSALRMISSAVVLVAIAVVAWLWAGQRIDESQQALVDGQQLLDRQAYNEAIERLQRGLDGLTPLPGATALKRTLRERLELARRTRLTHELHQFVERLRFLDGGSSIDGDTLRAAEQTCHTFWEARDRLLASSLAPTDDRRVRADLLDLLVFWLDLNARLPQLDAAETRERTGELLDQATATLGSSPVLDRERRFRLGVGGKEADPGEPSTLPAVSQRYALARSYLRSGDEEQALAEFRRAVREEPQEFWANFYRGRCAYRLSLYEEALNAFSVCIALSPERAECFFNRALVYTALHENEEALLDYDRALKLDPGLAAAAANREALRSRSAD
ncbi:MAG TPA: serine/threonine-protein kinase [Pirellulales bacterium]|nr:serine/threonine-protein kinase [Pirellulales bacterium]